MRPTNQYNATNAWNVNLNNGNVNNNNKTNGNQVRLVSEFCKNPDSPAAMDFLDFASTMIEAYYKCLRTKRTNPNAAYYALRGLTSTVDLAEMVYSGNYQIAPGIIFVVLLPIPRECCAATFRDRIVHDWVMIRLEPIYESIFPDAIMANRKGRGTLGAILAAQKKIYDLTEGYTKDLWVYSTDFRGFFMNLDKRIVNGAVQDLIDRYYTGRWPETLKRLFAQITFNCPQNIATKRSPDSAWRLIEPAKSLFGQDKWHGLPIGNLPSQWSACVIIMLAIRIFERHGITEIISYMDDTLCFIRDKAAFLRELPAIERELKEELNITLHPRKRNLQHYTKGWKMVGGKGKNGRLYASDRTLRRLGAKVHYLCSVHNTEKMIATINSYFGLMSHFSTYNVRRETAARILAEYGREIYFANQYHHAVIRRRFLPRARIERALRYSRKTNIRHLRMAA